jgi:hypothetical protein
MPHQGIVTLCISFLSICLTMSIIFYTLRHEKSQQAQNKKDEH